MWKEELHIIRRWSVFHSGRHREHQLRSHPWDDQWFSATFPPMVASKTCPANFPPVVGLTILSYMTSTPSPLTLRLAVETKTLLICECVNCFFSDHDAIILTALLIEGHWHFALRTGSFCLEWPALRFRKHTPRLVVRSCKGHRIRSLHQCCCVCSIVHLNWLPPGKNILEPPTRKNWICREIQSTRDMHLTSLFQATLNALMSQSTYTYCSQC